MAAAKREIYAVAPSRLAGQVRIGGAKNSALRLLVASLLTPEPVQLANYPDTLLDAQVQGGMPTVIRVELEGPLETYRFLVWNGDTLARFTLPAVGETLELPRGDTMFERLLGAK